MGSFQGEIKLFIVDCENLFDEDLFGMYMLYDRNIFVIVKTSYLSVKAKKLFIFGKHVWTPCVKICTVYIPLKVLRNELLGLLFLYCYYINTLVNKEKPLN